MTGMPPDSRQSAQTLRQAVVGPEMDIRHRCADATRSKTSVRFLVRKLGRWAIGGPVAGLKIGFGLAGGRDRRHLPLVPEAGRKHLLHFGAMLEVGSLQVLFGCHGSLFRHLNCVPEQQHVRDKFLAGGEF